MYVCDKVTLVCVQGVTWQGHSILGCIPMNHTLLLKQAPISPRTRMEYHILSFNASFDLYKLGVKIFFFLFLFFPLSLFGATIFWNMIYTYTRLCAPANTHTHTHTHTKRDRIIWACSVTRLPCVVQSFIWHSYSCTAVFQLLLCQPVFTTLLSPQLGSSNPIWTSKWGHRDRHRG